MLPAHEQAATGPLAARVRCALTMAGLAPDDVATTVRSSPQAISVRVLRDDGRDVTLEQLVIITAVLRSGEWAGRAITAAAA